MYKIIAHPGSAHKDDFLSTSVLLSTLDNAMVYRREPTLADLDDSRTFVVDVGMEYDPKRRNFDHHQDPALPCAFHLIMQHLGLHQAAIQVFSWYPYLSMIDVRGPYRAAEHLGIDSDVLFTTSSPIDGYILAKFTQISSLNSNDGLYLLMKDFGRDMLALIQRKIERFERLKIEAQLLPIKQFKAVFSEIVDTPKLAMDMYLRYLADEQIVMNILPSNRCQGWELVRLGDNRNVDFRAIARCPEIRFVHASGVLAKTHSLISLQELLPLACQAVADS
jgi:hypothetical protein